MKFDLHCHTKEGSIDGRIPIAEYVQYLKSMGYDGMLVTDHNSYGGYDAWVKIKNHMGFLKDFVVLKGIEYDTRESGHFLVILPEGVESKLLAIRGMTMEELEKVVHSLGGILGPAHPYGTGHYAMMHTKKGRRKSREMMGKFDFVEGINSCMKTEANIRARILAMTYHKPMLAGTDAHRISQLGKASTSIEREIHCNDDLIQAVKEKAKIKVEGSNRDRQKTWYFWLMEKSSIASFFLYNKSMAGANSFRRKHHLKHFHKTV